MKRLRNIAIALVCILAISICTTPAELEKQDGWIQLFNGKDLENWTPKIVGHEAGVNFADTFRVEDGLLTVRYDKYNGKFNGRFGHLFHNKSFSKYRLRVEYRFIGEQLPDAPAWAKRNSGIMIHGEKAEQMDLKQNFPVSIEVQLLGGLAEGERSTLNLCTPGTHVVMNGNLVTRHCTSSDSKTYRGDQWVSAKIEVHGNRLVRHIVEGKPVLQYSHPQLDPANAHAKELMEKNGKMLSSGTISLQSESHPIQFRKIELLPLD